MCISMRNRNRLLCCCYIAFCSLIMNCDNEKKAEINPWGVWNKYPVDEESNTRVLKTGVFYENGDSGLWIIKNFHERIPEYPYNGPAVAITELMVKLRKIERIDNGLILTLEGEGFKKENGKIVIRNKTKIMVTMVF